MAGVFGTGLDAIAWASIDGTNDMLTVCDANGDNAGTGPEDKRFAFVELTKRTLASGDISWMAALASIAAVDGAADSFVVYDNNATAFKTLAASLIKNHLLSTADVSALSTLAGTDRQEADRVLVWDNSATAFKLQPAEYVTPWNTFSARRYGATGDGSTNDTAAIQALRTAAAARAATLPVKVVFEPGTYVVNNASLFELFDNLTIDATGAIFSVADGATQRDASATDTTVFDNGLFYAASGGIDNFRWINGTFNISDDQVGPIQIGDSGTTASALNSTNVSIVGLHQNGGNANIVIGVSGLEILGCSIKNTEYGFFMPNNENFRVSGNNFYYIGVDSGETTWANGCAVQFNNARNGSVSGNTIEVTGAAAIFARSASAYSHGISVTGNTIIKAGHGGIELQCLSGGSVKNFQNAVVSGNVIQGFQNCEAVVSASSGPHSGISVGMGASVTGAIFGNLTVTGNTVSFLAPDETFNTTTYNITGSSNTDKDSSANMGTHSCIAISGTSASSYAESIVIANNTCRYGKRTGITVSYGCNVAVSGNVIEWCGWERDGSDVPNGSAHGIFVSNSAMVAINGNSIRNHSAGCDGAASSRTNIIQSTDSYAVTVDGNVLQGNDTAVAANAWNNTAIAFQGSAYAGAGSAGFTSRQCNLSVGKNDIYGTYWGLTSEGSFVRHLSGTGYLRVVGDGFISRTTGSSTGTRTVQTGVNQVIASSSATSTQQLPNPALVPGHRVSVKNTGAGTVTVGTAAGTITGTTSLTTGLFGTWQAEGTIWEQVA